jgi:trigger factor
MADATETGERIASEVTVEDVGPAAKRLTITVPAEAVTQKLEEALGALSTTAAVPGFRKGKAPRKLLERRFGSDLRRETRNQIIASAYSGAIEDKSLKPIGDPEPARRTDELELEEGKPFTFAVDVEVAPEFELPALDGIEIKRPVLDITDEMVRDEVTRYRRHFGNLHRIQDGFQEGDRLIGHADVTRAGETEAFFSRDEVLVVHPGAAQGGRGQVLGLLIDGLAGLLEGRAVADTVEFKTRGPEQHEREDIRGVELTIQFLIHHAERVAPCSVEAVVQVLGLESEALLHEHVRMSLEMRRDEEQAAAMRQQACDHLLGQVEFELPSKLTARQATRLLERHRLELLYRGMTPEEVEDRLAQVRAGSEEAARRQLKQFFLLLRLADHYEVKVNEQEIHGRVAMMAARRGMRPEQLMNELTQTGQLAEVAGQMREARALDRVVHAARVTDIAAAEWRALQEAAAQAAGSPAASPPRKRTRQKSAAGAE